MELERGGAERRDRRRRWPPTVTAGDLEGLPAIARAKSGDDKLGSRRGERIAIVSGDGGVVFRAASVSSLSLLLSSHQQTPGRVAVRSEGEHQNDVHGARRQRAEEHEQTRAERREDVEERYHELEHLQ
jgi:hypothetical protein